MCESYPQEASTLVKELQIECSKETGAVRPNVHFPQICCLLQYPPHINPSNQDRLIVDYSSAKSNTRGEAPLAGLRLQVLLLTT